MLQLKPLEIVRAIAGAILLVLLIYFLLLPQIMYLLIVIVIGLLFWPIEYAIRLLFRRKKRSDSN